MKKNYIQPNILVEKLDSFDVISTSDLLLGGDSKNPYASGDTYNNPILAPKRRGIWDSEY